MDRRCGFRCQRGQKRKLAQIFGTLGRRHAFSNHFLSTSSEDDGGVLWWEKAEIYYAIGHWLGKPPHSIVRVAVCFRLSHLQFNLPCRRRVGVWSTEWSFEPEWYANLTSFYAHNAERCDHRVIYSVFFPQKIGEKTQPTSLKPLTEKTNSSWKSPFLMTKQA